MRKHISIILAGAVTLLLVTGDEASGQMFGGMEQHATLVINSDGSSIATNEAVMARSSAEQLVQMAERFAKMQEMDEEDENAIMALSNPPDTKPLSDEELKKKLDELEGSEMSIMGERDEGTLISMEITKETVRTIRTLAYADPQQLVQEGYGLWSEIGVTFENVRLESNGEGKLQLTLFPAMGMKRYARRQLQQLKTMGIKTSLTLIFPGKIISSGLPETKDRTTSILADSEADNFTDVMTKMYDAPVVIVAESGGLKIDRPLESKELRRTTGVRGPSESGLPLTDAGPGFVAEATAITTTTVHLFPEGEKRQKEERWGRRSNPALVVTAKLFAPKGRTLQQVERARVIKAVDDKGRDVPAASTDDDGSYSYVNSGEEDSTHAQITLRLDLPATDARAIEKLSGEAEAITTSKWKEFSVTNFASNTNEIDLATLIPGAKMRLTKVNTKSPRINIQAEFTGPKTIQQLDLKVKGQDSDNLESSMDQISFRTSGAQATRKVTLQGFSFGDQQGELWLLVRFPEDMKRERVTFTLTGLDLL